MLRGGIVLRKTKIVATLGPSCFDRAILSEMIDCGLDVARLNFSHGTHESHGEMIDMIRSLAEEKHTCVTILQDLCGPKIRLGELPADGIKLSPGELCTRFRGSRKRGRSPCSVQ
jgi:pyruvate kinase